MNEKIYLGLSGGVDSAVAAMLLKKQGYAVEAVFMQNWESDDNDEFCTAEQDAKDAKAVAEHLGIKLHLVNFAKRYWDQVFEHFLNEYQAGRTPNPDILCNTEIKFKAFLDYALQQGASKIATGHYAQIKKSNGYFKLVKGIDENKDQSYFLHGLNQYQLSNSLFPLGNLTKNAVREMAQSSGLPNFAKKDSTGICFIGERKFKSFLNEYLPAQPGEIHSLKGEKLGRHDGLMYYTIGQRKGINIGGIQGRAELPWYVIAKNLDKNILIVAQDNQHPALFKKTLVTEQVHWIAGSAPSLPLSCHAKIRYRQQDQACSIRRNNDDIVVEFTQAQRAITTGQYVVFYDGEVCLGGAVIRSSF